MSIKISKTQSLAIATNFAKSIYNEDINNVISKINAMADVFVRKYFTEELLNVCEKYNEKISCTHRVLLTHRDEASGYLLLNIAATSSMLVPTASCKILLTEIEYRSVLKIYRERNKLEDKQSELSEQVRKWLDELGTEARIKKYLPELYPFCNFDGSLPSLDSDFSEARKKIKYLSDKIKK